jgi:hypothetical protein
MTKINKKYNPPHMEGFLLYSNIYIRYEKNIIKRKSGKVYN